MSGWLWAICAAAAVYAAFVAALLLAGRRPDARALAGFLPDCAVFLKRLAGDPRVPRRRKAALVLLAAYLAFPIDLVPDFIPVAGQLDDAILIALALHWIVRGGGAELVRAQWPGPEASRAVIYRLAGLAAGPAAA